MHLLHKALHFAECLHHDADLIAARREFRRDLAAQIARRHGVEVSDRCGKRSRDIIRDETRNEQPESERDQQDHRKGVDRLVIADIVRLKDLFSLKHVIRSEHIHIARNHRERRKIIKGRNAIFRCSPHIVDGADLIRGDSEVFFQLSNGRLRALARVNLFEFLHIVPDSVKIAEHIVHKHLAAVRGHIRLQQIRRVHTDFAQPIVRIVEVLRRHEVVVIHIVERLFRTVVRVDSN